MELLSKMRCVVTGSTGFTGQHLCKDLLSKGHEVHVILREGQTAPKGTIGHHTSLSDIDSLGLKLQAISPTHIFHLAAISFVGHENPAEIYNVNIILTENLLKAVRSACPQVEKVLIASSANVYGNPTVNTVSEKEKLAPINHYGCSKVSMEYIARTFTADIPLIITRPFNYTGQGQATKFLVPKIVSHFRCNKKEIELGNINISRDFSDVRDVVTDYVALIQSNAHSQTFNICSGNDTSLKQIITYLEDICGYTIKVNVNAAFVRATDIKVLKGDNSQISSIIGNRERILLKETLHWMLEA